MEFISKPVISCAGDENLISDFESHCLATLGNNQISWQHPKYSIPHSVRIEACFTRFRVDQLQSNVKVLSSGRPIRNVGTFQPILYIYVISNDIVHYTSKGGRNTISSWLGHLRARNVFDWLIVMVNSEPHYNTPKILQKSTVLDKIKQDFNIRTGDKQFLQVPSKNIVDNKIWQESWNQLTYLIRKAIINACTSIIQDYDEHLKILSESWNSCTWDYFEYLNRKEELAHMYMFLGGHEYALKEYDEATNLLASYIQSITSKDDTTYPSWLNRICTLTSSTDEASYYLCDYSFHLNDIDHRHIKRVQTQNCTLFELKTYLLSRQFTLLCICARLNEFAQRSYELIYETLKETKLLKIQICPILKSTWVLLLCLNTLNNLSLDSDRSIEYVNRSVLQLLDACYLCCNLLENLDINYDLKLHKRTNYLYVKSNNTCDKPYVTNIFYDTDRDINSTAWYMAHVVDKTYSNPFNNSHNSIYRLNDNIHATNSNMMGLLRRSFNTKTSVISHCWTNNYAVELWLLIFENIKLVGQIIGIWCHQSNSTKHWENFELIKNSINQFLIKCPNNELCSLDAYHYLIPILTSSLVYSQIFIATGQILIGFLKLINCPMRAYHVICSLADFLFTQKAYESAARLYEFVLQQIQNKSWVILATSIRLRLAWCLHLLSVEKHQKFDQEFEIPKRYVQVCYTLAGTKESILKLVSRSLYNQLNYCYQINTINDKNNDNSSNITQLISIPSFDDSIQSKYWWSEANDYLHTIQNYTRINVNKFEMDPVFNVCNIELDGVCDCGYELISMDLQSNTSHYYKVSIQITCSEPNWVDWQTILNPNESLPYEIIDSNHKSQLAKLHDNKNLEFHNINLRGSLGGLSKPDLILPSTNIITVNAITDNSSTVPGRISSIGNIHIYSQSELEKSMIGHRSYSNFSNELNNSSNFQQNSIGSNEKSTPVQNRIGSILNVAASLATKPAWKSQDQLNIDSDTSYLGNKSQFLSPKINKLASGETQDRLSNTHPQICKRFSLFPGSKLLPNYMKIHRPSLNNDIEQSIKSSTINKDSDTKFYFVLRNNENKQIIIKPGLNKLIFVAKSPGLFIPDEVIITCYGRQFTIDNEQLESENRDNLNKSSSTSSNVTVKFSSILESHQFGSSWRDPELILSLLPRPELILPDPADLTYPVILGICQPIPVCLRLGKLGLSSTSATLNSTTNLGTSLYRIVNSNKGIIQLNKELLVTRKPGIANDYSLIINENIPLDLKNTQMNSNKTDSKFNLPKDDKLHYVLEDGPIHIVRNSENKKLLNSIPTKCNLSHCLPEFTPNSILNFNRPLYVTINSEEDNFVFSLPSGHFYAVPLRIIRPLAFNLAMFPLQKSFILFSLRIASVDVNPDAVFTIDQYDKLTESPSIEPITFSLTNLKFYVVSSKLKRLTNSSKRSSSYTSPNTTPPSQHKSRNNQNRSTGEKNESEIGKVSSVTKLGEVNQHKYTNVLNGDLVDFRCTKAYVSHLTPVTILWRFRSNEFDEFMKLSKDQNCQTRALFQCTINRTDLPETNRKITVERLIQPVS